MHLAHLTVRVIADKTFASYTLMVFVAVVPAQPVAAVPAKPVKPKGRRGRPYASDRVSLTSHDSRASSDASELASNKLLCRKHTTILLCVAI